MPDFSAGSNFYVVINDCGGVDKNIRGNTLSLLPYSDRIFAACNCLGFVTTDIDFAAVFVKRSLSGV